MDPSLFLHLPIVARPQLLHVWKHQLPPGGLRPPSSLGRPAQCHHILPLKAPMFGYDTWLVKYLLSLTVSYEIKFNPPSWDSQATLSLASPNPTHLISHYFPVSALCSNSPSPLTPAPIKQAVCIRPLHLCCYYSHHLVCLLSANPFLKVIYISPSLRSFLYTPQLIFISPHSSTMCTSSFNLRLLCFHKTSYV